jgi:CcmD family protein
MTYLFIAYTVIWAALLVYSLTVSNRLKALSAEVDRLARAVQARGENR